MTLDPFSSRDPRCTCPGPLSTAAALFAGHNEPANACVVHTANGAAVDLDRARADVLREAARTMHAENEPATTEPSPLAQVHDLLTGAPTPPRIHKHYAPTTDNGDDAA
jgi:hypothetical protein